MSQTRLVSWSGRLAFGTVLVGGLMALSCHQDPAPLVRPPAVAEAGPVFFDDVTAACGVDVTYRDGQEAGHYAILESLGGGVALLDFDGDGLLDIFVPGGGYFAGPDQKDIRGHPGTLYRNLGGWKFQDVTAQVMPVQPLFYTHGCAVADYDCDGWPDLLVTGWGQVALYHNEPVDPADPAKGRRLVERAQAAGLQPITWATSAAWVDLDGDGYPDLYLCQYVDWSFANNPVCGGYSANIARDVCPPRQFTGLPHLLFRNNRDGTFTEIGKAAGLRVIGVQDNHGKQVVMGKGLGVIAGDLNGDGRPDVYVANDTVDNFLYFNRGPCKLEEVGLTAGVARDDHGAANGSMGLTAGDYDGTGRPSLFVTTYENEMHGLYRSLGNELFIHSTSASGIAVLGQKYVGFGTRFIDLDHHGHEDLVIANGHVIRHPVSAPLAQRRCCCATSATAASRTARRAAAAISGRSTSAGDSRSAISTTTAGSTSSSATSISPWWCCAMSPTCRRTTGWAWRYRDARRATWSARPWSSRAAANAGRASSRAAAATCPRTIRASSSASAPRTMWTSSRSPGPMARPRSGTARIWPWTATGTCAKANRGCSGSAGWRRPEPRLNDAEPFSWDGPVSRSALARRPRQSHRLPRDALQSVLPGRLRARVDERVLLETPSGIGDHPLYPDVRVVEYTSKRGLETRPETSVAVAEPLLVETDAEPVTESLLEIIDSATGNRVVTVIEFLSPSNKSPGPNREQYLRKQREVCASDSNLVEIDLNRFGTHVLAFPLAHLKPQSRTAYMACVRRALGATSRRFTRCRFGSGCPS